MSSIICLDLSTIATLNDIRLISYIDNLTNELKTLGTQVITKSIRYSCYKDWHQRNGNPAFRDRGDPLEYTAYKAFEDALKNIGGRTNRKLYCSVYGIGNSATTKFELDVVAVLGYQVVVVSCDMSYPEAPRYTGADSTSYKTSIKRKTIEAYHRTKQLGGDEGRTIMLCQASQDVADDITADLHDTIGTDHKPLQVWGKDTWPTTSDPNKLVNVFSEYLENLGWK